MAEKKREEEEKKRRCAKRNNLHKALMWFYLPNDKPKDQAPDILHDIHRVSLFEKI